MTAVNDETGRERSFVSGCCEGEKCHCGANAAHKVEETIFYDDPIQHRHPLTTYMCHAHFVQAMGPAAKYPGETAALSAAPVAQEPVAWVNPRVIQRLTDHGIAPDVRLADEPESELDVALYTSVPPAPAASVGVDFDAAIKEAIECITDLGSGKGGWAWEEVIQRLNLLSRAEGESDQR